MTDEDLPREHADLLRAMEDMPPTGSVAVPPAVLIAVERARRDARPIVAARSHLWRIAAVLIVLASLAYVLLPQKQPTAQVTITSPGDEIGSTQPSIAWTSRDAPGQQYDVWILPAEGDHLTVPALFKAGRVTSPVSFDQMKPGSNVTSLVPGSAYRVLVCLADAGRMAGDPIPFRVRGP